MNRLICRLALVLFASVASLGGQDAPPLARVITRDLKIQFPLHACAVASIVKFIARDVNIPAGVEYVPEECGWDQPEAYDASIPPLLLHGQTLEQAVNLLVRADPRYRWAMSDGVLVMRPRTAWADRDHFLNQSLGPFGFDRQNMYGALHHLKLAIGQRSDAATALNPGRTAQMNQTFTVKPGTMTMTGALDAIVRAHGAMQWEMIYCRLEARRINAMLWLSTTDQGNIGSFFWESDASGREVSACAPSR